jgi:hypothetical protein
MHRVSSDHAPLIKLRRLPGLPWHEQPPAVSGDRPLRLFDVPDDVPKVPIWKPR